MVSQDIHHIYPAGNETFLRGNSPAIRVSELYEEGNARCEATFAAGGCKLC